MASLEQPGYRERAAPAPSEVPFRWRLALSALRVLPQAGLSRMAGRLAELRLPRFLRGPVNGAFARVAGIDLGESARAPAEYPSLSAFFVRELRPGLRSWPDDPDLPGSPVDGRVGACGPLRDGTALQAKGIGYSPGELLGHPDDAVGFEEGWFVTLYLSPRHYHRIHAPIRGRILQARSVPGRLLPVNAHAVRRIPDLFPGNERMAMLVDSEALRVAVVAVGAYNVGRIASTFDPEWNGPDGRGVTNAKRGRRPELRVYRPPLEVARGDEVMRFHLGSTVVLLMAPGRPSHGAPSGATGGGLHPGLRPGAEIRLGDPLFLGR